MSTQVEAPVTPTAEPLREVAEAMKSASDARADEEARRPDEPSEVSPQSAEHFLSRLAYNGGYYLSYGVVFPTLFVVNIVPGGTAMVSGIVDGAIAASDYVHGVRAGPPVT
jgi:hypothetical protein